jgi:signal transduction histidine kinase/CheY-like chemotaxis protein
VTIATISLGPTSGDLAAKVEALSEQVKGLVNAEKALYESQQQLDAQVRVYRQLYEVGKRLNASLDVETVARTVVHFVVYELYFERCLVLLDDGGVYHVAAHEGFYDEGDVAQLGAVRLASTDPAITWIRGGAGGIYAEGRHEPCLADFARQIGLDELTALPIAAGPDAVAGIVVAGNRVATWEYHTRVADEARYALGLANLVSQSATALGTVKAYAALDQERAALEEKVIERTRELSTAMESLKALDKLKTNFFSNVSHELRTPLTLSIGPLEMLLRRTSASDGETRRTLESIHSNQLRLLRLINDLLDFAKIEAGHQTVRAKRIEVVETLKYYLSTVSAAAEARRMRLSFVTTHEDVEVFADVDMFEKVVMNLLSNAFKFTPDGGEIEVGVSSDADIVAIVVRDSGIGIPEDKKHLLFQRFSQLDDGENRRYEGTGIGLAMVSDYMSLHGGRVTVESRAGSGSTFRLEFRRGNGHLDAAQVDDRRAAVVGPKAHNLVDIASATNEPGPSAPLPSATQVATGSHRSRILVVDDNADLRHYISSILADDFVIETAIDGVAGLESARARPPDLIVSDVMMPRMSGYELCRAIKSDASVLSRVPVILLTAKAERTMRLEGLECGADDYLVKPFDAEELRARLRNLLQLRKQERQLADAHEVLKTKSDEIDRDLRQARAFQRSILPVVPQVGWMSAAVTYEPCGLVGGDVYDIVELPSGVVRIFLADAAGHGVQASLRTILLRAEYDVGKIHAPTPAAALRALNARLMRLEGEVVLHFTCACIDVAPGRDGALRATYANAGHIPLLVVGAGSVREVYSPGPLLGCIEDVEFPELEFEIAPGEALVVASDGLVEERGADGAEFGDVALTRSLLAALEDRATADRGGLLRDLREFAARTTLGDDVTVIMIRPEGHADAQ